MSLSSNLLPEKYYTDEQIYYRSTKRLLLDYHHTFDLEALWDSIRQVG